MTLEEYEKVLEEKRKALLALKTEERKVDSKEFESMQPLSSKKGNDEIFIKLVMLCIPPVRRIIYFMQHILIVTLHLLFRVLKRISVKRQLKRKRKLRRFLLPFLFVFFFSLNVLSLFLHNYLFNYSSIYLFLACAHVFIEVCKRADLLSPFLCYNTYLVHNTNN